MELMKELQTYLNENSEFKTEEDQPVNTIKVETNRSNVVTGKTLRKIQSKTLNDVKKYLMHTFGPMGSNTKIIHGENAKNIYSTYSKDGLKVLSNISNSGPIEASIVEEIVEITKHVEHENGDGTTSTSILAALIFDRLSKLSILDNIPPYSITRHFNALVEKIKDKILSYTQEITLDKIYDIAMISTNGNEEIASDIRDIYKEFGFNVELNTGISNNENNVIKIYDGLTVTEGFSDPVFINNKTNNTAEIYNARIYYFKDNIDDVNMINLFEAIIRHNIYDRIENNEQMIPTVICCPKLSGDLSSILRDLYNQMYAFDENKYTSSKPPILIVTNLVASDEIIMSDIANLCGCKYIHKYIDSKLYERDRENGIAPTVDNVADFYGEAELVVADNKKTKFINPKHMTIDAETEDPIYTALIHFLETEIEQAKDSENAHTVGLLKKRLSALKANMVDYLVGGITISERDTIKDLAEDAIKNCRSAAANGVGYAANFEGLRAAYELYNELKTDYNDSSDKSTYKNLDFVLSVIILKSYIDISTMLYSTVYLEEEAKEKVEKSLFEKNAPFNIMPGREDYPVLCSIMLDIDILDTLAKIISKMVTCNQCLLQAPQLNNYELV